MSFETFKAIEVVEIGTVIIILLGCIRCIVATKHASIIFLTAGLVLQLTTRIFWMLFRASIYANQKLGVTPIEKGSIYDQLRSVMELARYVQFILICIGFCMLMLYLKELYLTNIQLKDKLSDEA